MKRLAAAALLAGGLGMTALGARRLQPRPQDGRAATGPPGSLADIEGVRVHFVDQGEGAPIVLLHGFAGSSFSWRHVIPLLAANHRVIAVDFPGFGFSDRSTSIVLSHQRQAERVAALLDYLGVAQAVVVGHSMGGAIAQRLAIASPARVERLILVAAVDASAPPEWRPRRAWARTAGVASTSVGLKMAPLAAWMSRKSLERIVADRRFVTDDVVRGYVDPLFQPGTVACIVRMAADTANEPAADLSHISVPTLVLSGASDPVVAPDTGVRLAAKIARARHVIVPGAGHLLAEEQPEAVVEEILAFLHEPLEEAAL